MSASFLADPMIVTMLNVFLKAALIVAIAAGVTRVLRSRNASASSLHLVWTLAITALLVLPVLGVALPGWGFDVPSAPTFTAPAPLGVEVTISRNDGGVSQPPAEHESASRFDVIEAFLALYLLGMVVCLLRILVSNWRVAGIVRRSFEVKDHAWLALVREVAPSMGVRRSVRLAQSAETRVPMTWGSRRPVILLPKDARDWPSERRRAVLLHELAHVVRFDCLVQWLTTLVCAFYWIHPAVWYAASRLRRERERACDDHVLNAGMSARAYATELFDVASAHDGTRLATAAALAMADRSELEGRLLALMDGVRSRAVPSRRGIIAALLGTTAVTIPLACLQPRSDRGESAIPARTVLPTGAKLPSAPLAAPLVLTAAAGRRVELKGQKMTATAKSTFDCVGADCAFTNVDFKTNRVADGASIAVVVESDSACRGESNQTYFVFQVDQPAEFIFDSTVTEAPSSGRSGGLAVQFVVDQHGRPVEGSLKILRSTNDAEVARARNAFAQWRFTPALYQGCPVRQLVQVEVRVGARVPGPIPMYGNITAASDSASLVAAASDALQGRLFVTVPMIVKGYRRETNSVLIDLAPVSPGPVEWRNLGGSVRILEDGRRIILARR